MSESQYDIEFTNWSRGSDTLCQMCEAEYDEDTESWDIKQGPESYVEDVPARKAEEIISEELQRGAKPILDDEDRVQGYYFEQQNFFEGFGSAVTRLHDTAEAFIFTDCDEETYTEHYGEPYQD